MTISSADIDTMTHDNYQDALTTDNNAIDFTLDNLVTAEQGAALAGITSSDGSVTWHSIQDDLANLASSSEITDNLTAALAADSTVDITVTDDNALATEAAVLAVNEIVAAINNANDVTATFSIDKDKASKFSGVAGKDLTITVSDAMSVTEFGTLDDVTSNSITLTSGIIDDIGDLIETDDDGNLSVADDLTTAISENNTDASKLAVEIESEVTTDFAKVSTLAAAANIGAITGSITGTATELLNITGLDTSDPITFKLESDASVLQLKNLSDDTSLANITFTSGNGISDDLDNLISNEEKTDNFNTALAHLTNAPDITLINTDLSAQNVGDDGKTSMHLN